MPDNNSPEKSDAIVIITNVVNTLIQDFLRFRVLLERREKIIHDTNAQAIASGITIILLVGTPLTTRLSIESMLYKLLSSNVKTTIIPKNTILNLLFIIKKEKSVYVTLMVLKNLSPC